MKQLGNNSHSIQVLKDPFKATQIESINLRYSKVIFETYFAWEATIRFKNGNTSGAQDFKVTDIETDNAFEVITKQIQAFINSL
jgi:hypothetical protein